MCLGIKVDKYKQTDRQIDRHTHTQRERKREREGRGRVRETL